MNRAQFVKKSARVMALASIAPSLAFCDSNHAGQVAGNYTASPGFNPDIDLELTATPSDISLFQGQKTPVFTYSPKVFKAENATVESLPGSWLGPVFRVKQGQKIRVRFKNQLPRESVIHWHGLHINRQTYRNLLKAGFQEENIQQEMLWLDIVRLFRITNIKN